MTRAVLQAAIDLVKSQEGFRAIGYADVGGVPTDGWGNTHGAVVGQPAVDPEAKLAANLQAAADELASVVSADVIADLTDNQYSALIDFVFNEGTEHAGPLWAVLNAKQFDQVPMHLVLYVYAGHPPVKLMDLVRRRNAEVELWGTGEPGSDTANGAAPVQISSAVTRTTATPGAPVNPRPRGIRLVAGTAVAVVAGAIPQAQGALQAVSDAVTPYESASHIIGHILSLIGVVSAGLAVTVLGVKWLQDRKLKSWSTSSAPALHPALLQPESPMGTPLPPTLQQPQPGGTVGAVVQTGPATASLGGAGTAKPTMSLLAEVRDKLGAYFAKVTGEVRQFTGQTITDIAAEIDKLRADLESKL